MTAANDSADWSNSIVDFDPAVDPAKLTAHPLNARTHPESQRRALRESLDRVGWVDVVKVNTETGRIVDGHARVEEAVRSGGTVPVLWVNLSEEQERYVLATLDPISAMAEYDQDMLVNLITGLDIQDDLLKSILDEPVDVGQFTSRDDVDEINTNVPNVTEKNDIWRLGQHAVICGDSTDSDVVTRLLCGRTVDMVWTDPPYGVDYIGKTADALTIDNDNLNPVQLEALLRSAFGEALRACRPGATWFVAAPAGPQFLSFAKVLDELKIWRQTLVWLKNTLVLGRSDYHYRHEVMFYGWKPGAAHTEPPDRKGNSVWEFDKPARSAEHPTMKPVELIAKAIRNHTNKGDLVLDPFGGSGSTLIAAHVHGRVASVIEIDPAYVDVICARYHKLTGDVPVNQNNELFPVSDSE